MEEPVLLWKQGECWRRKDRKETEWYHEPKDLQLAQQKQP